MKKHSIPIFILLVFLSAYLFTACERKEKGGLVPGKLIPEDDPGARVHLVELQVNTADLKNLASSKKWRFVGQGPDEPDSLFTTLVRPGDKVIWVAVSSSSLNDSVEITKIKHMHGVNLLTKNTITDKDGIVIGNIIDEADPGAEGKYELSFKARNKLLEVSDEITVDPKLRIHD